RYLPCLDHVCRRPLAPHRLAHHVPDQAVPGRCRPRAPRRGQPPPIYPAKRSTGMAGITRTANAHWQGTGKEGKGALTTQSGVPSTTPFGYNPRFGDVKGTNPEELLAASHAGCFSMALAFALTAGGFTPESIATTARVTLEPDGPGFKISRSALTLEA